MSGIFNNDKPTAEEEPKIAKEQDIVEKVNEEYRQYQEDQNKPSEGTIAGPPPETEAEKTAKKMQKLNDMISQQVVTHLQPFKEDLIEQREALNQILALIQQGQTQQQMPPQPDVPNQQQQIPPGMGMNDLPPDMKAEMLSKVGTSLAQIIRAWKGENPSQSVQSNDMYGEMFKQMGLDIVQAGLDGIKQQIYPQFVPQPRNINYVQQQPAQYTQGNETQEAARRTQGFK